jgi:hypothetical protein
MPPFREETMQALRRLWQKTGLGRARQAWGLAPSGRAWALVGLSCQSANLWQVHASSVLIPPLDLSQPDAAWLRQALVEASHPSRFMRQPLAMSLPAGDVVSGQMVCPLQLPERDWPAEVQLEVAEALKLPPEAVHFDFAPFGHGLSGPSNIQWVGCARSVVLQHQQWIRDSRIWRLACVEPEMDALRRAAQALLGGLPSLLKQAPQDWQFRWPPEPVAALGSTEFGVGAQSEDALRATLTSPAGSRLVAAGLALKACV